MHCVFEIVPPRSNFEAIWVLGGYTREAFRAPEFSRRMGRLDSLPFGEIGGVGRFTSPASRELILCCREPGHQWNFVLMHGPAQSGPPMLLKAVSGHDAWADHGILSWYQEGKKTVE